MFLAELDREAARSRKALAELPDGQAAWQPHDRSMTLGYLAFLVANIPTWIARIVTDPSIDIAPADGPGEAPRAFETAAEYTEALDHAVSQARTALERTTEAHLQTQWQLLARGQVVLQMSRQDMISDTLAHWVHHRGQLTVYLRLVGARVPALFGPSADDRSFG